MFLEVTATKMGIHFGNLGVKVNGLIYYSLSPHEQKATAGMLSKGFPNAVRRFRNMLPLVVPRKCFYCVKCMLGAGARDDISLIFKKSSCSNLYGLF